MKYNYYAIHFHMKSGGVKIVIENLMKAFVSYSWNTFSLIESGKQFEYKPPFPVNHITISSLDYNSNVFHSKKELELTATELADDIERNISFSSRVVLHAHNMNLFKNTLATTALRILAERHPDNLLLLLQVHDFAEDNRPELLKRMQRSVGKKDRAFAEQIAYPLTKNTTYLTINSRDKRLLQLIGIPKERIFVFPNAVNTSFFTQKPIHDEHLLELIASYSETNGFYFDIKRKNIIYPVKILRRKNVIEALLILNLLNSISDEYQLLITLDASSKDDISYAEMIKKYIKKRHLPVTIGFGFEVISPNEERKQNDSGVIEQYTLPDLFSHAECIISTSILEGFGFAFVEGWLANKQVVGRRIPFIMEDFETVGITFPAFYDAIIVDGSDFSSYSHKKQLKLLDSISYKELLAQEQVKQLVEAIRNPNELIIKENKKIILREYSLKKYLKELDAIIETSSKLAMSELSQSIQISNCALIEYFKEQKEQLVIITDLDATFLDHETYSYEESIDAYSQAINANIPVCFCTSKAFFELKYFIDALDHKDPFITENGSAIYIPKRYFSFNIKKMNWLKDYSIRAITTFEGYDVIELNVPHAETLSVLRTMQKELSYPTYIYSEHSVDDLVKYTNQPPELAKLSKIKQYADGFRIPAQTPKKIKEFKALAKKHGFQGVVGGRFVGINKGSDKGKATEILLELFRKEYKRIVSLGLGDSQNDIPLLFAVDYGYFVAKPSGKIESHDETLFEEKQVGPVGWSAVVSKFVKRYSKK